MTDDAATTQPTATPTPAPDMPVAVAPTERRCPWCSELLPADANERCPFCKVLLTSTAPGDTRLPGLTEVEAPSTPRARLAEAPKRSKLLSWISGDVDDEVLTTPLGRSDPEALALPARDVRREMLRLKLEAEGITVALDGSLGVAGDPTPSAE